MHTMSEIQPYFSISESFMVQQSTLFLLFRSIVVYINAIVGAKIWRKMIGLP